METTVSFLQQNLEAFVLFLLAKKTFQRVEHSNMLPIPTSDEESFNIPANISLIYEKKIIKCVIQKRNRLVLSVKSIGISDCIINILYL